MLLALQAHSDDIPLSASGTVAKLIDEGKVKIHRDAIQRLMASMKR